MKYDLFNEEKGWGECDPIFVPEVGWLNGLVTDTPGSFLVKVTNYYAPEQTIQIKHLGSFGPTGDGYVVWWDNGGEIERTQFTSMEESEEIFDAILVKISKKYKQNVVGQVGRYEWVEKA